jgi:tetratricopeptide (TPR) repeat protein/pimeloyl-ACP methyl ester carboxylesterase
MVKLTISGRTKDLVSEEVKEGLLGDKIRVTTKAAIQVADARAGEEPMCYQVDGDTVVELELEGGIRLWMSVDQMQADLAGHGSRGGEDGLTIPRDWPVGARSRGAGAMVVTGLRLLDVDLAGMSAQAVADYLESQLDPGPGLYRCPSPEQLEDRISRPSQIGDDGPLLVFIHGTASRTGGGFGGLSDVQPAIWEMLIDRYGGRVYAFEHRTLTCSPIENALELAELLPTGAEIHLVTHSRGGLVGELLCQGRRLRDGDLFDADDLALFDTHGTLAEASRDQLRALGKTLQARQLRIERFVRVACPARGTTLASQRLDRYLSILLNTVGLIPALKGSQTYDFLKTLLLAVAKKRIDPGKLPGLEAQMPSSPLVQLLNRADVTVDADLSVIAGDLEGRGVWGRLKTFATDLFYREDHDLVVNTAAMYGGTPRSKDRARRFFDQGEKVDHFSYFSNESSAEQLAIGLTRIGVDAGRFEQLVAPPREIRTRTARGDAADSRSVVFILPGIMGSHLKLGDDRIWADLADLARGRLHELHIDALGVAPDALIAHAYLDLVEFLEEAGHEVIPFPYDWRLSILEESRRFGDAVATKLDETSTTGLPVHFLAHSMGGLVARAMLARQPSVWQRWRDRSGSRLLMLGTPNGGSYVIPRMILGRERLLRQLALIDLRHDRRELSEIVSRFRGLLELLPVDGDRDLFKLGAWQQMKEADDPEGCSWMKPDQNVLQDAFHLREVLARGPVDPERMLYIAGQAPATPIGIEIGDGEVVFVASREGDGRVPWQSGLLEGVPTWYMPEVKHGRLPAHRPAFAAIDDLLCTGHTDRLPQQPPVVRGVGETFRLAEDDPDDALVMYPGHDDLVSAAIGYEPAPEMEIVIEPPVRVEVAHGDLCYSVDPIAVGHYEDDSIASAESILDRQLGGVLRRDSELGRYPGAIGTFKVAFNQNPDAKPGTVLVVGLGRVGALTHGNLKISFARAAVELAMAQAEHFGQHRQVDVRLATLLIGSTSSGLPVSESVGAILDGVLAANQKLSAGKQMGWPVRITALTFVEIYQDRALKALHAIKRQATLPSFTLGPELNTSLGGGRSRVFDPAEPYSEPSSWQRLVIEAARKEHDDRADIVPLQFTVIGDRARSEVVRLDVNRRLVDSMITEAMSRMSHSAEIGKTLFELLVPNALKDFAPEQRDLVLEVDDEAARYPWEILVDRATDEKPLSATSGLMRQLRTGKYRTRVKMSTASQALVIGDPQGHLAELPEAQAEARAVVQLLEHGGFEVVNKGCASRPTCDQVISSLLAHNFRVIHLAGHGEYSPDAPDETGMVIGDHTYLTPAVVEQMRQVPELVFVNCCHLGLIEGQEKESKTILLNRLAANLGSQLIRMGVRAVVAAGWPVDDKAARTFAQTFYQSMLAGEVFGHAVKSARLETFRQHSVTNTWGAYQCYGDPEYRLDQRGRRSSIGSTDQTLPFVAPVELIAELQNLVCSASLVDAEHEAHLLDQVRKLDSHPRLPKSWKQVTSVRTSFGRAYCELGDYQQAVAHFQAALELEDARVELGDVELLANIEMRLGSDQGSVDLIQKGLSRIEALIKIGRNSERLSLFGSGWKRLAAVRSGKERTEALARMTAAYLDAYKIKEELNTYPLLNYLIGRVLLRKPGEDISDVGALLDRVDEIAAERLQREPSFWNAILPADAALVRHLANGNLSDERCRQQVIDLYRAGFQRASSARKRASVYQTLDFLISMYPKAPEDDSDQVRLPKSNRNDLREIRRAITVGSNAPVA